MSSAAVVISALRVKCLEIVVRYWVYLLLCDSLCKVYGTLPCFTAIFLKGDNFDDFLFASLDDKTKFFQEWVFSERK